MKILQINKYFYLKGGADSVFFNTIKLLEEKGHQVIPFCTNNPKNEFSEWSYYFVDAPEIRDLKSTFKKIKSIPRFFMNNDAARKLEKLIIDERPDLAHIHNIFNGISLSILPILKKYNIPIVVTMHDTRFICPSSYFNMKDRPCLSCKKLFYINCFLKRCYQNNLSNSAMCMLEMVHKEFMFNYNDYIYKYIFLSNHFRKIHIDRHQYFNLKSVLLPNCFSSLGETTPNYIKGKYLLYYGRITREKGIERLVDVMKHFPNVTLKIAGNGPLLEELRYNNIGNIDFLGFLSNESLASCIQNASFIIVPSECEENNPLTISEAYAHGKPVIGSRIGGIPEMIIDGITGLLFEASNIYSLQEAIDKAISVSDYEYEIFSKNARLYAEKNFSPDKYYEGLLNIYNEILKKT